MLQPWAEFVLTFTKNNKVIYSDVIYYNYELNVNSYKLTTHLFLFFYLEYCASQNVSASELKKDIFDLAKSYQQEEEMKLTAASELLHKKADDIQNTFTKMMQEMIQVN